MDNPDKQNETERTFELTKTYITHLIFCEDYGDPFGWCLGELTYTELQCLDREVDNYNKWIEIVQNGMAPAASYWTPEESDNLYLAHNSDAYLSLFPKVNDRGCYEKINRYFKIVCEADSDELFCIRISSSCEVKSFDHLSVKHDDLEFPEYTPEPSLLTMGELICGKFWMEDSFSMGYRLLPFTKKLFDKVFEEVGIKENRKEKAQLGSASIQYFDPK